MKVAYFDCFCGISGDMTLGALVDAGLDTSDLERELAKLGLDGYTLQSKKVKKKGISASKIDFLLDEIDHPHRNLSDIEKIIDDSSLDGRVRDRSKKIFGLLAEAEAKVHGVGIDEVHFHEVGALDSILDIVGSVVGLEFLGVERVYSSPVRLGSGTVMTAHGLLPVPAPATAELLRGVPSRPLDAEGEVTTPTGAAILKTLSSGFGEMPSIKVEDIGYGAGNKDFPNLPNLLRVFIGEISESDEDNLNGYSRDTIKTIEANIDDLSPEIYDHLMDVLLGQGALDVYLTPIAMKKNRPATKLSVLAPPERIGELAEIIFRETTTIGLRINQNERLKLHREIEEVETPFGRVRVKVSTLGDSSTLKPEYEDCKKIAKEKGIPLREVYSEVVKRFQVQREH